MNVAKHLEHLNLGRGALNVTAQKRRKDRSVCCGLFAEKKL